eukprot:358056-Chlamydomonas_euryale.AAC.4
MLIARSSSTITSSGASTNSSGVSGRASDTAHTSMSDCPHSAGEHMMRPAQRAALPLCHPHSPHQWVHT